jgi:DNA-binding GntR family transcriptional regulator
MPAAARLVTAEATGKPVLLDPRNGMAPRVDLAERVLSWLTEQLVNGILRPGQWLSENEIAGQLGVSRSPVREAFRTLAQEGLVDVRPRRGTVIAGLSAEDAADVYSTRQLIYAEMARLAVEHITDDAIDDLASIIEDMRESLGDARQWYDCTRRWWQRLMDLCPSRSIREIAAMLWRRSIRFRGILLRMAEQQHEVLAYAERFLECAQARDGAGAHAATAAVLGRARDRLLDNVFLQLDDAVVVERPPLLPADGGASQ